MTPCARQTDIATQEDQDPLPSRILIPLHSFFPCLPSLVMPSLLVYIMHQRCNSFDPFLSFSCLSLSFCVVCQTPSPVLYKPLLLSSYSGFYMCSFQYVCCPHNSTASISDAFSVPLLYLSISSTTWIFSLHILLSHYLPWLDNSSHPFHLALNGLSPTTISSCSHSSFPSLLSLYVARRTSFPPWVLQTPVWILKVEGEVLESEDKKEEDP